MTDWETEPPKYPNTYKTVPEYLPQRGESQIPQLFHRRRSNRELGPRLCPRLSTYLTT